MHFRSSKVFGYSAQAVFEACLNKDNQVLFETKMIYPEINYETLKIGDQIPSQMIHDTYIEDLIETVVMYQPDQVYASVLKRTGFTLRSDPAPNSTPMSAATIAAMRRELENDEMPTALTLINVEEITPTQCRLTLELKMQYGPLSWLAQKVTRLFCPNFYRKEFFAIQNYLEATEGNT